MELCRRAFATGAVATLALAGDALARGAVQPVDALRADFDELFERLGRAHFDLCANRSRREHQAEHARLRRLLRPGTTRDEAVRIFQRFVAFGRVAHARIDAAADGFRAYQRTEGRLFPLTLRVKAGRVFVTADASGSPLVSAGDELLALEGHGAMALLDSLWPDVSADTAYMFHSMLEWELARLLWQRFGSREAFRLTLQTGSGRAQPVTVRALPQNEIEAARLEPPPLDASPTRRTYRVIGDDVGYLRPGPFYNAEQPERPYDNRAFVAFIDNAFRQFGEAGMRRLIIDLRDNPGGDNSFSDHLVSWFATRPFRFASAFRIRVSPEAIASNRARLAVRENDPTGTSAALARAYEGARMGEVIELPIALARPRSGNCFTGMVFILINRHSYSNAVNVAALVQDYGFGTVMGEETSDLATTLGAMERFTLTRTGISVGFPKARIVRPSGDLSARGVVPDLPIETPAVETADDPVLERALGLVRLARA